MRDVTVSTSHGSVLRRIVRTFREKGARRSVPSERKPVLLCADPIWDVLAALDDQLLKLRQAVPGSDVVAALSGWRQLLANAVERAGSLQLGINSDEAARIIGRSPGSVARRCRSGTIAARKVGGVWVIDRAEFERLFVRSSRSDSR